MSGGGFTGIFSLVIGLVIGLGCLVVVVYTLGGAAWVLFQAIYHLILRPGAWLIGLIPERAGLWIGTVVYSAIAGSFVLAFYGLAIYIAVSSYI